MSVDLIPGEKIPSRAPDYTCNSKDHYWFNEMLCVVNTYLWDPYPGHEKRIEELGHLMDNGHTLRIILPKDIFEADDEVKKQYDIWRRDVADKALLGEETK